jgi:hypothetical protein
MIVRFAALGSSVVLVGVYIGCRAAGSAGSAPVAPAEGTPATNEPFFGGSKSMAVFPTPQTEPAPAPAREFMGGSKSAAVIRPAPPAPQQTQAPR